MESSKRSKVNTDELPLNVSTDDVCIILSEEEGDRDQLDLNMPVHEDVVGSPEMELEADPIECEDGIAAAANSTIPVTTIVTTAPNDDARETGATAAVIDSNICIETKNIATQTALTDYSNSFTQTVTTVSMNVQTQTDTVITNSIDRNDVSQPDVAPSCSTGKIASSIGSVASQAAPTTTSESTPAIGNYHVKLEKSLALSQKTIKNLNERLGDEHIASSDTETEDDDDDGEASGTDSFSDVEEGRKQFDGRFARRHGFVTNVRKRNISFNSCSKIQFVFCLFLQINGDRFYLNGRVRILAGDFKMLKTWNDSFPSSTVDGDSRFVAKLLEIVFGIEVLALSSATGRIANNGVHHAALEPGPLNFIKGNFVFFVKIGNLS